MCINFSFHSCALLYLKKFRLCSKRRNSNAFFAIVWHSNVCLIHLTYNCVSCVLKKSFGVLIFFLYFAIAIISSWCQDHMKEFQSSCFLAFQIDKSMQNKILDAYLL